MTDTKTTPLYKDGKRIGEAVILFEGGVPVHTEVSPVKSMQLGPLQNQWDEILYWKHWYERGIRENQVHLDKINNKMERTKKIARLHGFELVGDRWEQK